MNTRILERFYDDVNLRECAATVLQHDERGLMTDATVFYPNGGGQPGDIGQVLLEDGRHIAIVNTRRDRESREILHQLEPDSPRLPKGSKVRLQLDWPRRYRNMRMHTCMHLLSAVVKAGVTGGDLNDQRGRLDFDTGGEPLDRNEIEAQLRQLIEADLPIHIRSMSGTELAARPELIKTMAVQPPLHLPEIRLIEIENTDLQPCGGTHVTHTAEIGAVQITKITNKGAHNRRVTLAFVDPEQA